MGVMYKYAVKFSKAQIRALKAIANEKKLKGRDILDEYSEDEIAESFNGAGSSAASELERKILTRILRARLPGVMIHDMEFRKGGTEKDFHDANEDLEYNMSRAWDGDDDALSAKWWRFVGRKAREYSENNGKPGWGKA